MNHPPKRTIHERIYVEVTAGFDSTGYMQPTAIIWNGGKILSIEKVKDFCPNGTGANKIKSDCYTVVIHGQDKHLYFERYPIDNYGQPGRWFVEKIH